MYDDVLGEVDPVKAMSTDVFLTSVNALAETGEMISIDGIGNRVASMMYGHKKAYLVIGRNKLAENFEKAVIKSSVPVLVDFFATWCGPCRMQGQILERYEKLHSEEEVRLVKIDCDEEEALAREYKVETIPTLLVFKNGELVERVSGVRREEELDRLLGL